MGTDNIFHKRKAKDSRALRRQAAKRSAYDKVLIVCEGEKTETFYLQGLIDFYELNTANVKVDGSGGSAPSSVVRYAIELFQKEQLKGDSYDRVYCVIDRDAHQDYDRALQILGAQKPVGVFFEIVSIPCFEYWLLCHFYYSRAPFNAVGNKSSGDLAYDALKGCWPEYKKGTRDAFEKLGGQLEFAKENARRGVQESLANGAINPTTHVYEMVEYLQRLKN